MIARVNEVSPFAKASGILDIGCGTGPIVSYILDKFGHEIPDSSSIFAADFSDHMLAGLRSKQEKFAEKNAAWRNLKILNLDAHDLSAFASGSVSIVTSGHMYFLLDDFRKALQETARVLCPGGVLAITNGYHADHTNALYRAIDSVRPGTNANFIRKPWDSLVGISDLLQDCGFVDVEVSESKTEMRYVNIDDNGWSSPNCADSLQL